MEETASIAPSVEPLDLRIANAAAAAADVQRLAEGVAEALGDDGSPATIRLWARRDDQLREVARAPIDAVLPPLSDADSGTILVELEAAGRRVGTLEARRLERAPAIPAWIGELLATRLESLLDRRTELAAGALSPAANLRDEIQEVVELFASEAQRVLPHDRLSIYLLTPDGMALERFAVASSPPVPGDKDVQPLETVGVSVVVRTNQPIVSDDFGVDERIQGEADAVIYRAGYRSLVTAPLRLRGKPFGIINFVSRRRAAYSARDAAVAQQIADQIASFLRDLRLQQTIRESLRRSAVQEERERLAREFHDTLAQSLAELCTRSERLCASLQAQPAPLEEADAVRRAARDVLEATRVSLFAAPPRELDDRSLFDAIRELADRFDGSGPEEVSVTLRGDCSAAANEVQATALRIVQESLANVRKHARARTVAIAIAADDAIEATVRDDGVGFSEAPGGFGLTGMRQRAAGVGGALSVTSRPGRGTEVTLRAPLDGGRAREDEGSMPLDPPQTVVRVLVADDHPVFREGIVELLNRESDLQVIGEAGSQRETLAAAEVLRPDLIMLDFDFPDGPGTEVAQKLSVGSEAPVVLMMSAFDQGANVAAALDAGAQGYLSKASGRDELINAIRAALQGAKLFNSASWAELRRSNATLTHRELEILQMIAEGRTNSEIGEELHLAVKTIERVVRTICTKLNARNRTHAVACGLACKLISTPSLEQAP
jgi:DNA-binding NarL/FixJ family response regulator/signal transduction histidine kinase